MSLAPCPSPSQRSISPSYSRKTQEELDTQFLHDRIQQYYLQVGRQNCFCGILSHLTTFSQYKSLDCFKIYFFSTNQCRKTKTAIK